eukprot:743465-Rhodomonas_salina.2
MPGPDKAVAAARRGPRLIQASSTQALSAAPTSTLSWTNAAAKVSLAPSLLLLLLHALLRMLRPPPAGCQHLCAWRRLEGCG